MKEVKLFINELDKNFHFEMKSSLIATHEQLLRGILSDLEYQTAEFHFQLQREFLD